MLLTRKYHFYAAHRNQELCDKCRNIHGHQYEIRVEFDLEKKSSITTLFSELDAKVKPIMDQYDHGMLIDRNDPLFAHLMQFPESMKFVVFDAPTSVENLVQRLYFQIIIQTGLSVYAVEVDETKSSTLRYTREDAAKDHDVYVKALEEFSVKPAAVAAATDACVINFPLVKRTDLVSDLLWSHISPLLPESSEVRRGRRAAHPRDVIRGILYAIINGVKLEDIPVDDIGCTSAVTCKRYMNKWIESGLWNKIWAVITQFGIYENGKLIALK